MREGVGVQRIRSRRSSNAGRDQGMGVLTTKLDPSKNLVIQELAELL